ncbi:hypothetical protein T265_07351 [Opisthorchis viverrini]|uniref:Uncharacterized protein n=1 Tax=Opisthorchis viverrini TaxID=6198 RepID=A0A074ZHD9_OPIVI|nr:hypothetical protein T265_07351 [Opisthorchis viverrini]KER25127.1 hypothetical protein T265_07351 [Opisthorchis viverrini]
MQTIFLRKKSSDVPIPYLVGQETVFVRLLTVDQPGMRDSVSVARWITEVRKPPHNGYSPSLVAANLVDSQTKDIRFIRLCSNQCSVVCIENEECSSQFVGLSRVHMQRHVEWCVPFTDAEKQSILTTFVCLIQLVFSDKHQVYQRILLLIYNNRNVDQ